MLYSVSSVMLKQLKSLFLNYFNFLPCSFFPVNDNDTANMCIFISTFMNCNQMI